MLIKQILEAEAKAGPGEPFIAADSTTQTGAMIQYLLELLAPFAALCKEHHTRMPMDQVVFGIDGSEITAGDLISARDAIRQIWQSVE